jgi:hypothetical protein
MFSISAVPAVLLALGMAFSPESPRWLFQVFFVVFNFLSKSLFIFDKSLDLIAHVFI